MEYLQVVGINGVELGWCPAFLLHMLCKSDAVEPKLEDDGSEARAT